MRDVRIAAAQFEGRDGDKKYNLSVMTKLAEEAVAAGAEAVTFHEMSICNYSFLQDFTSDELRAVAEPVPSGPSAQAIGDLSSRLGVPVLAGILEVDEESDKLYNTYFCFDCGRGCVAVHRKLHAFINPHVSSGSRYTVFDLLGCRCAILICYGASALCSLSPTAPTRI